MEKRRLIAVQRLETGYGTRFGFHPAGRYWASADTGMLHLWDEFQLVKSHAIPSYIKGNIVFTSEGLVRLGLFEVDFKTGEKKYRQEIAGEFGSGTLARFDQYKTEEVLHFPGADMMLVAIGYQPGKALHASRSFTGPSNRLLLFQWSSGKLIKIIAENDEGLPYSNLIATGNGICYIVDDLVSLASVSENDSQAPDNKNDLSNFVAYDTWGGNIIVGGYQNRIMQFREINTLKIERQLPFEFDEINGVCVSKKDGLTVVAANKNMLQCWNNNNEAEDTVSLSGTIEGLDMDDVNRCWVAVAGAKYYIEIFAIRSQ